MALASMGNVWIVGGITFPVTLIWKPVGRKAGGNTGGPILGVRADIVRADILQETRDARIL